MSRYAEAFARSMEEAAVHAREGRLDAAAAAYRRALRHQPNEWVALAHLGACERFAGRYAEAERVLLRALLARPEEPGTLNELSLVMVASGRPAEAIGYLVRATRAAPTFLQGWTNLGKLLYVELMHAHGTPERATLRAHCLDCFDRILALDPGQVEFKLLRDAVGGAAVDAPPEGYVAQFFDRFAAGFDEKVSGKLRYTAPEVAATMLAPLPSMPSWSIVDLGCGTGLSGRIVKPAAARLVGVDVSSGMLEHAARLGIYDELVQEELLHFLDAQAAGGVDLVLALDVFIYVGALDRVMAAAARVLRPAGRMLFSVETGDGPGFSLAPSGRFQQSARYVEAVACSSGLQPIAARDFEVRQELGRGIAARMFLLAKGGP